MAKQETKKDKKQDKKQAVEGAKEEKQKMAKAEEKPPEKPKKKEQGPLNKGQAMLKAGLNKEDVFAFHEHPDKHVFVTVDGRKVAIPKMDEGSEE